MTKVTNPFSKDRMQKIIMVAGLSPPSGEMHAFKLWEVWLQRAERVPKRVTDRMTPLLNLAVPLLHIAV